MLIRVGICKEVEEVTGFTYDSFDAGSDRYPMVFVGPSGEMMDNDGWSAFEIWRFCDSFLVIVDGFDSLLAFQSFRY